ncbi:MAG: asparaginase [Candidatus Riflebacteria bacterium]|nr:asparaginase [Candidatus Riflebacteria bacterium]
MKESKPKILLVTTGGTISMQKSEDGTFLPSNSSDSQQLTASIPELNELAAIDILQLANIDSTNLQPELWAKIAQTIYKNYKNYEGFVLAHGTDTLAYTASALSFMIQELGKPIAITGSQVPLMQIGSDGRNNLINAVRVAISDIAEVAVVFGSTIIKGSRAKKVSAFDMEAFSSVNDAEMGKIGLSLKFSKGTQYRSKKKPILRTELETNIAMLPVYPGIKPEVIDFLAETHKGIVLEGYGAGNIPTGEFGIDLAVKRAIDKGVPVVICTQCVIGSTEMELYQVGRSALDAGAIPAMDMTPESAFVKLMWVMAQTKDLSSIAAMMQKNFAGEVHELGGLYDI